MKLERTVTFLWGSLLAFIMSMASVGCLVSAFSLTADLGQVALCCAVAALFCSLCYTLRLWLIPAGSAAVICGFLWSSGMLEQTVESLLYRLSRQYDLAYKWGVIRWSMRTTDDMELTQQLGLCIIGVLIVMAIAWAICRRKTLWPGMGLCLLCLGACVVVTDTVPGLFWLFCLLLGAVFLLLTHPVRRQDPIQGNRLSFLLALPLTVLVGLLLLLSPQKKYTGQAMATAMSNAVIRSDFVENLMGRFAETGTTGSSVDGGTVQLDAVGPRLNSNAEVLELRSNYAGRLYLRGRALDTYDGKTWTDSGRKTAQLYWPDKQTLPAGGEVIMTTKYSHKMLYLPYYVTSTDLTEVTRGLENKKKLKQYSFSCAQMPDALYLEAVSDDNWRAGASYEHYVNLPEGVKQWAQPLVAEIVGDIRDPYLQAKAIGAYVRNSATYDTNTWKMPSGKQDFAKWFLEDSDTGYCVHFATAATVLLQAAGIPARYVTGYTTEARVGYLSIVRAQDAHAWAEYWLPGFGWTVLEATPAATEQPATEETQGTVEATLPATMPMVTTPTEQQTRPGATVPQSQQPNGVQTVKLLPWLWSILGAAATVGVLLLQRRLRLQYRQRRLHTGDGNCRALAQWQEAVRLSRILKQPVDPLLLKLAQKAKFSQYMLTEEEVSCFGAYIDRAHSKMRARSVFMQFWYRIILALY